MPNKGDPFSVETLILKNVSVAKTETGVTFISVNGSTVVFTGTFVGNFSGSGEIIRGDGVGVVDESGNPLLGFDAVANAVNYVQIGNGPSNNTLFWSVVGDTSSVGDFSFNGKRATVSNNPGGYVSFIGGNGIGSGDGGRASLVGGAGGSTGDGGNAFVSGGAGGSAGGNGGDVELQGASAVGGNANGGNINLSPGSGVGSGKSGAVFVNGVFSIQQGPFAEKTTSTTLTAAELYGGIITVNQGGGATSALQAPTASALDTALPSFAGLDSFQFSIVNISSVAAEDATLTTNTGITLIGNMNIPSNAAATDISSARFQAIKAGTGAWTIIRIS